MKKQVMINLSTDELEAIIEGATYKAIKSFDESNPKELKYYTIDEACDLLKVSRPTITKYITSGDIKASKVSGMYRISHIEIDKILESAKSLKYKR